MSTVCVNCHNFTGEPHCAVCRTLLRIKWFVEHHRLGQDHFHPVLSALREAAGVVQDAAEHQVAVLREQGLLPGLPPAPVASGGVPSGSGGEAEEKETEGEKAEEEKHPDPEEESGKSKKKKELKKLKKLVKAKREKKEKEPKEEESKEKKDRKEKAKEDAEESREKDPDSREVLEAEKKAAQEALEKEEEENREEKEEEPEDKQSVVDEYVSTHPAEFHLGALPVRGSAASHFGRASGSARPPEPPHPPRNHGAEAGRDLRDRSRSRTRRGTKGAGHRERGRERNQWPKSHWEGGRDNGPQSESEGKGQGEGQGKRRSEASSETPKRQRRTRARCSSSCTKTARPRRRSWSCSDNRGGVERRGKRELAGLRTGSPADWAEATTTTRFRCAGP